MSTPTDDTTPWVMDQAPALTKRLTGLGFRVNLEDVEKVLEPAPALNLKILTSALNEQNNDGAKKWLFDAFGAEASPYPDPGPQPAKKPRLADAGAVEGDDAAPPPQSRPRPTPEAEDNSTATAALPTQAPTVANHHIYSSNAAICFELGRNIEGGPAIHVQGAVLTDKSGGGRKHDWDSGIRLMLKPAESLQILGVVEGFQSQFEAKFHGRDRNKSIEVAVNSQRFLVSLAEGGKSKIAVPLLRPDAVLVASIIYRYLRQLDGTRSEAEWRSLLEILRVPGPPEI